MKLGKLRIGNFRCYRDQTITFDDYTCLIGPGGAGKSTILIALRVFFRDTAGSPFDLLTLQEEDFHNRDTSNEITITATFTDLDSAAQEEFKHYVRQGQLVVSAIAKWDEKTQSAEVKQFGQRLGITAFREFFKADGDGASVTALREIYARIEKDYPELGPQSSKSAMKEALTEFEGGHPDLCELQLAEDQFYGFTKGTNRLRRHLEWVFVPAVKDVSTEQLEAKKTALGLLLERTVRTKMSFSQPLDELRSEVEGKYRAILEQNQSALESLSTTLGARLKEWAHPDARLKLSWRNDPARHVSISEPLAEVIAGEGRFEGTLARLGHGFQRSFLLALLHELSGCVDTGNPKLLLACEEPELHQHPPQARHLSSVLQKLSRSNTQVVVSTHSPYFVSGKGFQDVRIVQQGLADDESRVRSITFQELSEKLADALGEQQPIPNAMEFKVEQALQPGLNEMFFSPILILVEGPEDAAYIAAHVTLSDRTEEFRRLGCHIVATSGKGNMVAPLAIAKALEIPTFVIFDADGNCKEENRPQHQKENLAIMRLCDVKTENAFPSTIFSATGIQVWPHEIGKTLESEFGTDDWLRYKDLARKGCQIVNVPKLNKNVLFIGQVLTTAYESGAKSAILDALCNQIIAFARSARSADARASAAAATGEA